MCMPPSLRGLGTLHHLGCPACPLIPPAPSCHVDDNKCVNAHVRPLQAFRRPRSGVHDLVQPIRGAPRRQARPAIEVTIARCDNTSSWEGVEFPQLGGRPTTIDHDGAESCGGAVTDRSGQRARHSVARRKKNRCHRVNNESSRCFSVSGDATRGAGGVPERKRGVRSRRVALLKVDFV